MEVVEQSIPTRFEQQATQYAHRLAVKTPHHELSYAALNAAANRCAHAILDRQGEGAAPVGLLLEQGPAAITALLGVLKAGKIAVPLDPSYPQARTRYMLADAQPGLLLTNTQHAVSAHALAQDLCPVLDLETLDNRVSPENPGLSIAPEALAYILYTSGSTGQPKGVVHTHRTVLHMIMNETNGFGFCAEDRLTLLYSPSFIGAVRGTFGALLNGAALLPFDVKTEGIGQIATWLIEERATYYNSVATLFRHFVRTLTGEERFPQLRLILIGSETIYKSDVELYKRHFGDECVFVAGMGATEISSIRRYFMDKETEIALPTVPVGHPETDTQVLLLDEDGREVGENQVGEITVKSRYLSLGYWRRPELTQVAFLADPTGGPARLYRTGDLGRFHPDGCLEHLGRKDEQVKIRGYRIDTAEIETHLRAHQAIKDAVVVAREAPSGGVGLVAYLVLVQGPAPTISALRTFLTAHLPAPMVPSAFVWLEALPLTPSGKVDRQALPAVGQARPHLATAFVAPRTLIEEELVKIWAEVLGLDWVGIHDHFLELGGHSLVAMQLIGRVRDAWAVDVPLHALLETATVAEMAVLIVQTLAAQVDPETVTRLSTEFDAGSVDEIQRHFADGWEPPR